MPSGFGEESGVCRYKSKGHHTDGFDTKELAETYIADNAEKSKLFATGAMWDWDGENVPAMVEFFKIPTEIRDRAAPS